MKQFRYGFTLTGLMTATLLSFATPAVAIGFAETSSEIAHMADQSDGTQLNLKAGNVLEMTFAKRKLGYQARQARRFHDKIVRPFAFRNGQDFLGQMNIEETIIGDHKPSSLEFFSYRSAALRKRVKATKAWEDVRSQRRDGWKQVETFSVTLPEGLNVRFDPAKSYTLAIAWANPAYPQAYDQYLDGITNQFEQVGARFVHKFRDLDVETRSGDLGVPPLQITIVEWDDEAGLTRLLSSEAYKKYSPYFRKGVSDFRLYRLK